MANIHNDESYDESIAEDFSNVNQEEKINLDTFINDDEENNEVELSSFSDSDAELNAPENSFNDDTDENYYLSGDDVASNTNLNNYLSDDTEENSELEPEDAFNTFFGDEVLLDNETPAAQTFMRLVQSANQYPGQIPSSRSFALISQSSPSLTTTPYNFYQNDRLKMGETNAKVASYLLTAMFLVGTVYSTTKNFSLSGNTFLENSILLLVFGYLAHKALNKFFKEEASEKLVASPLRP